MLRHYKPRPGSRTRHYEKKYRPKEGSDFKIEIRRIQNLIEDLESLKSMGYIRKEDLLERLLRSF